MEVETVWSNPDDAQLPFLQLAELFQSMQITEYDIDAGQGNDQSPLDQYDRSPVSTERLHSQAWQVSARSSAETEALCLAKYESEVLPIVKALFPRSLIGTGRPKSVQDCSNMHTKLLVYAATNRLAGVNECFPLKMVYQYLERPFTELINGNSLMSCRLDKIPSILPMAETFFTCAIEVGDVQTIHSLLLSSIPGVHVNDTVCVTGGHKFTPIERSAKLQHLVVTRLLLRAGADVNKTYSEIDNSHWRERVRRISTVELNHRQNMQPLSNAAGALECALSTYKKDSDLCYELLTDLAVAGGRLGTDALSWASSTYDSPLIKMLIRHGVRIFYSTWIENDFLHKCSKMLDREILQAIFADLHASGYDLSRPIHQDAQYDDWKQFWIKRESPPHWIDIVAQRGDLGLVISLLNYGAQVTPHVLVAAIRSDNVALVQYLLCEQAPANVFSTHFLSTPLAEAVRMQHQEIIQLLSSEVSVGNIQDGNQMCAMLAATAESGDTFLLKSLMTKGCHCSEQVLGYALTRAILAHQPKTAIILLEAGASLDPLVIRQVFEPEDGIMPHGLEGFKKSSPLVGAISTLDTALIRRILDHGANLNGSVEAAVACGDLAILEDILSAGSTLWAMNEKWYYDPSDSGFHKALENGDTVRGRRLVEADIMPTPRVLLAAVRQDDVTFSKMVLESEVNCLMPELLGAAVRESPEMFQLILQSMIRWLPNGLGRFGVEALDVAIELGRQDLVKLLIDRGAHCTPYRSIRFLSCDFKSALATAIRKESGREFQLVRNLLNTGRPADEIILQEKRSTELLPDVTFCETALLIAVSTKQPRMVRMILEHGADINLPATGNIKRTPLQQAAESGSYSIVELLLEQGADVNGIPAARAGATALQLAAFAGNIGIVELLLDNGADPMAPGAVVKGWTAIEGAAECGHHDMVSFLLRRCSPSLEEIAQAERGAQKTNHQGIVNLLQRAETEAMQRACKSTPQLILGNTWSEQDSLHTPPSAGQAGMKQNEDGRPTCAICGDRVSNTSALRRHERTKHADVFTSAEWKCGECSKSFSRKDTFNRHLATHNKIGYAECPSCGHNCRPDYLVQHMTTCQS